MTGNKLIILLMTAGLAFSAHAQQRLNDQRTNETKIADIVMQLPVKNTETLSLLMQELIRLDNVIPNLTSKLLPKGQGDDSQIRTAISELTHFASRENDPGEKTQIAGALCKAIREIKSDELKEFLLTQLEQVAGDESVETAALYLGNIHLANTAACVLTRVNNDAAGKALLNAGMKINTSANPEKVNLENTVIAALGDMHYKPAVAYLTNAVNSEALKGAALHSLAQIADPSSGKLLAQMADRSGYMNDSAGAAGAYLLFLENSSAQGNQSLATDAANALLGKAKSADNRTKAGIITFLGNLGDNSALPFVLDGLKDKDTNVVSASFASAGKLLSRTKDVQRIANLLSIASNKEDITVLQQSFFNALSGQSRDQQTEMVIEQASNSSNPNPYAYGNILAMIGGQKALDVIMNYVNSEDQDLREAAFESLVNWSDDLATPQLYKIAAGDPSGQYFDKALTAFVSKVQSSKNTPEQKLLLLRNACQLAHTSEQKTEIINRIATTGTFPALITAGALLDDSNANVRQAAVEAVITIALAHPEYYGKAVTELVNKALQLNKSSQFGPQVRTLMKRSLPKDDGFVSMFNGKDLAGWKGLVENPIARAKMSAQELSGKQAQADEIMRRDWKVENGLLVFEGKGFDNLCSDKKYGDIELYVDWRIAPEGDAGVYLRGSPQVQIWDTSRTDVGAQVGSGGLYNNQKYRSTPLLVADNPVNEWNSFHILMEGDKVTVYLNGQLVTDHTILENYWDRSLPIFSEEAIELQAHGTRVEYRDIYVREIPRPKPYEVSDAEKKEGFVPLFNGVNLTGWVGNLRDYYAKDGMIICDPEKGGHGNLYTEKEYSDFVVRFEFKLTPAANNGLGIRAPLEGDAAYVGMELQILDNEAEVYKDLHVYQYHGSVYGVIPAKRGYLKPVGEWNYQEVVAKGNHITITLNGTVILDGDIAEASKNFTSTIDGNQHPGLSNKTGHIGFLGHGSWVAFKNLRIKELK